MQSYYVKNRGAPASPKPGAETENKPGKWNAYGVVAAKLGEYAIAESAFNKAIRIKPGGEVTLASDAANDLIMFSEE